MYKQSIFAISALAMLSSSLLATEQLDDIVVTAKSNQARSDLAGAVTVITAEDIKKYNATDIKDVLVKTAGIAFTRGPRSDRKTISIRGSQSDHVLILVDGKKISGTDANIVGSDFQYSWVPMNSIERIEIIKGAASSLYGSEAIGGVINIITKKSDENFYGNFDIQFGANSDNGGDAKELSFNVGGKATENLSVSLALERKDIEVVEEKADTYLEGKEYTNGIVKLSYNIDDSQSISASYMGGEEERLQLNDTLYYDISRKSYDFSYQKKMKDISFKLDYYAVESENHYISGDTNHKFENDTFKGELDITSIKDNYIVLGAETKIERYDDSSNNFLAKQKTNSFFIQDEIEFGNDFILTLGARHDDHEVFGGEFSPKANLLYKIADNQRLRFGYGEGFVAPGLKENSANYKYVSTYGVIVEGNPDLKPETSKNYDIGYDYYFENGQVKFNVFRNDVKNLIDTSVIQGRNYTYKNVTNAEINGLEVELDYDINDNHNVLINYTHVNAQDKDNDKDLTYRPENSANLVLNSKLPYDVSSTVSLNYMGEQYTGSNYIDDYTTTDIQFSKLITKDLTIRFGMDNIADDKPDTDDIRMTGRFTYVGLNYKF